MMSPTEMKLGGRDNQCDVCEQRDATHYDIALVNGVAMPLKFCTPCYKSYNTDDKHTFRF